MSGLHVEVNDLQVRLLHWHQSDPSQDCRASIYY